MRYYEQTQRGEFLNRQFASALAGLSPQMAWNRLERGADPQAYVYGIRDESAPETRKVIFFPRADFTMMAADQAIYFNALHLSLFSLFYMQPPNSVFSRKIFNAGMERVADEIKTAYSSGGETYVREILTTDLGYKNPHPGSADMLSLSLSLIDQGMKPAFVTLAPNPVNAKRTRALN